MLGVGGVTACDLVEGEIYLRRHEEKFSGATRGDLEWSGFGLRNWIRWSGVVARGRENLKSQILLVYHTTTLNLLGRRARLDIILLGAAVARPASFRRDASCTHGVRGNYNCNAVRRKRYTGIHRVYMTVRICGLVSVESVRN